MSINNEDAYMMEESESEARHRQVPRGEGVVNAYELRCCSDIRIALFL